MQRQWLMALAMIGVLLGLSACAGMDYSIKREVDAKVRSGVSGAAAAQLYEDAASRYLAKGDKDMAADMLSDAAIYWDGINDAKAEAALDQCNSLGMRGSLRTITCDSAREVLDEARAKRRGRASAPLVQPAPAYAPSTSYPTPALAATAPAYLPPTRSAPPSTQQRTNPVNHCVQIRPRKGPNGPDEELFNACPTSIAVNYCTQSMKKGGSAGGTCPSGVPSEVSLVKLKPGETAMLYTLGEQTRVIYTACRGADSYPRQSKDGSYCIEK